MNKLELVRFVGTGLPRRLVLTCDREMRRKAVQPFGASPLKGGKFSYPAEILVVIGIKSLFKGEKLEITEDCTQWFEAETEKLKGFQALAEATDALPASVKFGGDLKTYQNVAVQWARSVKRGIIADDRGLGKTLESIAIASELKAQKVLVVCPSYLKLGWQREIKKWTTQYSYVLSGERKVREALLNEFLDQRPESVHYCIVNYEMLRPSKARGGYPKILEQSWDCIFYDEGHRLCNRNNQWVEGAKRIKAPYQFILTGNPISNMPDSAWSLLNILYPNRFTSYWAFVDYFCDCYDGYYGKEIVGVNKRNLVQLQFLLRPLIMRRLKADVAPFLPEKIHKYIEVDLEGSQKTFYNQAKKKMLLELEEGGWDVIDNVATLNLRLHQAVANPAILGGKAESVVENATLDLISDLQFNGEKKIIVGTRFKGAIECLKPRLDAAKIRYYIITGDIASKDRDGIVEAFKSDTKPCILLGTIFAMSEGINADECDNMIFMSKSPRPLDNMQFMDRIHRITSTRVKNYYHIVVRGTVSAFQEDALQLKTEMQEEILSMEQIEQFVANKVRTTK